MINQNKKIKVIKKQYDTKRLYLVVVVVVVFFTAITFLAVYNLITVKPEIDHSIPFATNVAEPVVGAKDNNPKNNVEAVGLTRREDVYNFLVAGESLQLQTDAMMIVNYDVGNNKISVVQIPRDTYINIGRNFNTFNCYFTGEYNSGVKHGADRATLRETVMDSLKSFVEQNLNVKIDYWILVNLAAFRNIVDIIGGVEVTIENDMFYEDPFQDLYIDLKAGTQILNGDKAEQFVRFRDGYAIADKGRMDAQKIFMTAFLDKIKSSLNVNTIPKMINEAIVNVTTSLTNQQCIYFSSEMLKINFSDVTMVSLPTTSIYSNGGWYEVLNRHDALNAVNKYVNVYEQDIESGIFDINRIFTDEKKTALHETYNAISGIDHEGLTAADIGENSIHIPIKQN